MCFEQKIHFGALKVMFAVVCLCIRRENHRHKNDKSLTHANVHGEASLSQVVSKSSVCGLKSLVVCVCLKKAKLNW